MENNQINYVEFKAKDLKAIKTFYTSCFGWKFTDYGPTYTSFTESGLFGGFEKTNEDVVNGALVVLYHNDLNLLQNKIVNAGGKITVPTFSFPGGKRFHFQDPSGNELAVWSDN